MQKPRIRSLDHVRVKRLRMSVLVRRMVSRKRRK